MAQIKYVEFACLLLLTGFLAIIAFQKISSTEFIKEKPANIDAENTSTNAKPIDPQVSKGGELFKANCGSCHALDKVLSGPALRGVLNRGPWIDSKENFMKWVRNPAAFIQTNEYTRDLQKQFGQVMPSFSHLDDNELEMIYQYLGNVPVPNAVAFNSR